MRLVVQRMSVVHLFRGAQYLLLATGLSMIAYCGAVLVESAMFQNSAHLQFDRLLRDRAMSPGLAPPATSNGLTGRIEITRLRLSVMVAEGVDTATLRRAAGHIPGTSLPGQPGNVGISAHRDTFFRPLRNIRRDDVITLTTLRGEYRYRVVSTAVVKPTDVAVLIAGKTEVLTLVTCYPFYFVGSAPHRFIVRAERITA